jgi:hypothetical protein
VRADEEIRARNGDHLPPRPDRNTIFAGLRVACTELHAIVMRVTNQPGSACDTYIETLEVAMLVRTLTGTRKRRAVEFRLTRSPRDLLLSLPVRWVDGETAPLAPLMLRDLDVLGGRAKAVG